MCRIYIHLFPYVLLANFRKNQFHKLLFYINQIIISTMLIKRVKVT